MCPSLCQISQNSVKNSLVAAADVIFLAGNPADSAYLKVSGGLTYCHEDRETGKLLGFSVGFSGLGQLAGCFETSGY